MPKELKDFPKYEYKGGVIYQGDCLEIMALLKSQSIDLKRGHDEKGVGIPMKLLCVMLMVVRQLCSQEDR